MAEMRYIADMKQILKLCLADHRSYKSYKDQAYLWASSASGSSNRFNMETHKSSDWNIIYISDMRKIVKCLRSRIQKSQMSTYMMATNMQFTRSWYLYGWYSPGGDSHTKNVVIFLKTDDFVTFWWYFLESVW